jgi:hypothetical protein
MVVVALTGATGDRVLGLFGLLLVSGSLYLLGPPDLPIAGRVIGGLLALAGAALCHAQTWVRGYIDWAGYRYRSDFSGRLLSIVDLGANR